MKIHEWNLTVAHWFVSYMVTIGNIFCKTIILSNCIDWHVTLFVLPSVSSSASLSMIPSGLPPWSLLHRPACHQTHFLEHQQPGAEVYLHCSTLNEHFLRLMVKVVSYIDLHIWGIILHKQQWCTHNNDITCLGWRKLKWQPCQDQRGTWWHWWEILLLKNNTQNFDGSHGKWIGCTFSCTFWRHYETVELFTINILHLNHFFS